MKTDANASSKTSVFAALDEAPMTPVRYLYWLLASGGTLLDGFSVVSLGIAVPLLKRDMTISPFVVGLIGSALVLGAVLGAVLGGVAADRLGRKRVFIIDMAILTVGFGLCVIAHDPGIILVGQFVIGIGVGIDFPTSSSYVSEIMPRAVRSRMTIATIAMQSVGMIAAALTALAIFRAHPSLTDWRILLGAGGLIGLAFVVTRLRLPESPRWLAEKHRLREAAAVLSHLTGIPASLAGMETVAKEAPTQQGSPKAQGISALFAPHYRARTLLISLPWLMMDVATYGVGLFTPVILGAMHFGSPGSGTLASVYADAKGSGIVDLFLLFGFIAGMWAVPRFRRIPMQIGGFAGMTVGMLLLMFAARAGNGAGMHVGMVIAGFIIFNFAMNVGPNSTTFTLAPVLFPTAIRASASGFAAACAKIGATVGTFVVPQLQAAWGLTGVLALMAFVSIGGLVATAIFAHEVHDEDKMEETPDEHSPQGTAA